MAVANDLARGADLNAKLLLLLRAEETHLPMPDAQFVGHQLVRLLQPDFALQVGLGVFVDIENDRGLITSEVFAQVLDKRFRTRLRIGARNLEIDGSFGECAKEIFVGE